MYVINLYALFNYLAPWHFPQYLREKFDEIPPHPRIQDTAAIFRYPYYVILRPIYAMSG